MTSNKGRFLSSGLVAGMLLAAGPGLAVAQEAVRIGTSSVGSVFYTLAQGAGEIVQKHAGVNTTVEPVGGSAANIFGLGAGKIEFAIANSFAAFSGYTGTFAFKDKIDLRLIAQGQPSYRYLMLRKGANIKSPKDLEGRTIVAKRRALPELELLMGAYAKSYGLDASKIKVVATTNTPEVIKALEVGSVDAAILPFSARAPQVQKPMQDGFLEFFYVSKDKRDEILGMLPDAFFGDTLKTGTFDGQEQDVHIFGLNTYFLTRPGVPDDVAYKVSKAIFENTKEFASYHRSAAQWTAERAVGKFALPFHAGTVKFLKEKGIWTAEHEARQARLLKR